MNILLLLFTYIVITAFYIRTIRNIFYVIFLWQLKEYRIDRVLAHLKSPLGKKIIFGRLTSIKWVIFIGIITSYLSAINFQNNYKELLAFSFPLLFLYWLVWIIEAVMNMRELILFRWRVPQLTPKTLFLIFSAFFLLFIFIQDMNIGSINLRILFLGPFLDRFIWLYIAAIVTLTNIPSFTYRKYLIYQAKKKILSLKKLTVVGITGSYGKTSTKEFLATILSEKFQVAKLPGSNNTDFSISKYILQKLKPEHRIFIVEMGAYKTGEIKQTCAYVFPKIGIITGINEQHLELFGSIENTMKTKFELIKSLPKDGKAIFNGNSNLTIEMAKWSETLGFKTIIFKTATSVKNIKLFKEHIEFDYISDYKKYKMKANLLGVQTIENILAAIYAARNLGMKMEDIQKGVSKIISPVKTMQIVGNKNGLILIDDTFNANPNGVLAAIDYMKQYERKKILVLTPLIELGDKANEIHTLIGEKAVNICNLILLTNINYHKAFIDGAKKSNGEAKVRIVNVLNGTKLLRENMSKDSVMVFEGKEAGRILKKLVISH